VDRCHAEVLASAFWPDATVDYGAFKGTAAAFIAGLIPALGTMKGTMHTISNVLMTFDGARAHVETYCRAVHIIPGPDGEHELEVGGRYIDAVAKRAGEWRIAHRLYVADWSRAGPATAQWDQGVLAQLTNRGARFPDDPIYRLKA
jgi:hypothetical protein